MDDPKEKRRAYARQWYAANRDRLSKKQKHKTPEKIAYVKAWRIKNHDRLSDKAKAEYARKKLEDPVGLLEAKRRAYRLSMERNPEAVRKRGREYMRAYRAAHPERRQKPSDLSRERRTQTRKKLRATVLDHYGGRCACCGESGIEFLCIDHADGNGAAHRREMGVKNGAGHIYLWLRTRGFPQGFRVLCHNCNMALGFYGYCPHELRRDAGAETVIDEQLALESS